MQRLSSPFTTGSEVVFPAIWLGIFGATSIGLLIGFLDGKTPLGLAIIFPCMWTVQLVLFVCMSFPLKHVSMDSSHRVRGFKREIDIPLSEIVSVCGSFMRRSETITIELRHPTIFGSKIKFIPSPRLFKFSDHPTLTLLQDLVESIKRTERLALFNELESNAHSSPKRFDGAQDVSMLKSWPIGSWFAPADDFHLVAYSSTPHDSYLAVFHRDRQIHALWKFPCDARQFYFDGSKLMFLSRPQMPEDSVDSFSKIPREVVVDFAQTPIPNAVRQLQEHAARHLIESTKHREIIPSSNPRQNSPAPQAAALDFSLDYYRGLKEAGGTGLRVCKIAIESGRNFNECIYILHKLFGLSFGEAKEIYCQIKEGMSLSDYQGKVIFPILEEILEEIEAGESVKNDTQSSADKPSRNQKTP